MDTSTRQAFIRGKLKIHPDELTPEERADVVQLALWHVKHYLSSLPEFQSSLEGRINSWFRSLENFRWSGAVSDTIYPSGFDPKTWVLYLDESRNMFQDDETRNKVVVQKSLFLTGKEELLMWTLTANERGYYRSYPVSWLVTDSSVVEVGRQALEEFLKDFPSAVLGITGRLKGLVAQAIKQRELSLLGLQDIERDLQSLRSRMV